MSNSIQYLDKILSEKKSKKNPLEPEVRYIVWEKFCDPFGEDVIDQEFPGAFVTANDISDYNKKLKKPSFLENEIDHHDDGPELQLPPLKNNGVMATPMGLVPITEYTNPFKIFNFWTIHSNFSLMTNEIRDILDNVPGLETVDIFTRYRARISIGKAFSENSVKLDVQDYLNAKSPPKN